MPNLIPTVLLVYRISEKRQTWPRICAIPAHANRHNSRFRRLLAGALGVRGSCEFAMRRPVPPQLAHADFGTLERARNPILQQREMLVSGKFRSGFPAPGAERMRYPKIAETRPDFRRADSGIRCDIERCGLGLHVPGRTETDLRLRDSRPAAVARIRCAPRGRRS